MKDSIEYTKLSRIIEEVCEPYTTMFRAGHMTFSEFAIMENIVVKLNEKLREDQLDVKNLIKENEDLKKENEELKEKNENLEAFKKVRWRKNE